MNPIHRNGIPFQLAVKCALPFFIVRWSNYVHENNLFRQGSEGVKIGNGGVAV